MRVLVNMLNVVEWTRVNTKYSEWFLLNEALRYYRKEQSFSCWRVLGVFLKDFHAHVAAFENLNPYCCLNTQNELILDDPTIKIVSLFYHEAPSLR